MAIKSFNPTTPSRRHMTVLDKSGLSKKGPEKSLTKGISSTGGRNNQGRITTRFRGAGNKRRYRVIDFKRFKEGVPATVISIEYDPNRTANIALIQYEDGEKAYIIAPVGLKAGDKVMNGPKAELKPGNSMKIKDIPVGVDICCIELTPGRAQPFAFLCARERTVTTRPLQYIFEVEVCMSRALTGILLPDGTELSDMLSTPPFRTIDMLRYAPMPPSYDGISHTFL